MQNELWTLTAPHMTCCTWCLASTPVLFSLEVNVLARSLPVHAKPAYKVFLYSQPGQGFFEPM